MSPLIKALDERKALLGEVRRIRKAVVDYLVDPSSRSLGKLKGELDQPAPSHLFAARKGGIQ